ncbi:MAG: efflux RND transporter periplasmic adaptor subunit [Marinilabiliaceae bacterium]|nr:efflux RND transporter periplasmic adaptor subunit [Marinilabiliaceae bacterium]
MKKALYFLALVMLVMAGCRNQDGTLEGDVEIPVSVEDIQLKSIEEFVSTTGTVFPIVDIELKSEISGDYFLEINPASGKKWQLGDRIRKGDLIARIEDEEFVNSIKLDLQKLNLELAESEMKKQEAIYEKGGVTLKELKDAGASYMNAKYSLENAEIQMKKMKIVAPFDGVVTDLPFYTQGAELPTGSSVASIMDYRTMYLDISLPEKYMGDISVGQAVRLTNYTIPDDTITGKITQLSPAINADTRTFKGNIFVNNPELLMRPGMFVKAEIVTNRKDSVIVIPKDIILSRQRGMTVYIVDRGVAMERTISTGLENNKEVEVVRGLEVNQRVVTDGFETLSQNAKVTIIK